MDEPTLTEGLLGLWCMAIVGFSAFYLLWKLVGKIAEFIADLPRRRRLKAYKPEPVKTKSELLREARTTHDTRVREAQASALPADEKQALINELHDQFMKEFLNPG